MNNKIFTSKKFMNKKIATLNYQKNSIKFKVNLNLQEITILIYNKKLLKLKVNIKLQKKKILNCNKKLFKLKINLKPLKNISQKIIQIKNKLKNYRFKYRNKMRI